MRAFRIAFLLSSLFSAGLTLAAGTAPEIPTAAPVAAPVATPAPAAAAAERCSAYTMVDGRESEFPMPSLRVMELTAVSGPFVLPKDAPANVTAIQCWRDSILPTKNDYKVFRAGFPFFITAPTNRTLSLAYSDGQLTVTFDKGLLSDQEIKRVHAYIALFQKKTARR
jgi:hypothetical protein